ncbi:hypothetical protein [uncultured Lamprocystis sp.]|uniref:hypothetical protein n=1 Tax=uncultured Lamprocystis sp. TaxID=543132 RepID=UPI0025F0C75E|nr:hypothetical protein [uncultured Lamprocystis sp.]
MYTTYRLKTEELDADFLDSLRVLFKNKTIEIAVCEAEPDADDETAYLLRSPDNRKRLMEAIENVRQGHTVQVDLDNWNR